MGGFCPITAEPSTDSVGPDGAATWTPQAAVPSGSTEHVAGSAGPSLRSDPRCRKELVSLTCRWTRLLGRKRRCERDWEHVTTRVGAGLSVTWSTQWGNVAPGAPVIGVARCSLRGPLGPRTGWPGHVRMRWLGPSTSQPRPWCTAGGPAPCWSSGTHAFFSGGFSPSPGWPCRGPCLPASPSPGPSFPLGAPAPRLSQTGLRTTWSLLSVA